MVCRSLNQQKENPWNSFLAMDALFHLFIWMTATHHFLLNIDIASSVNLALSFPGKFALSFSFCPICPVDLVQPQVSHYSGLYLLTLNIYALQ